MTITRLPTTTPLNQWLAHALEKTGVSQAKLAEQLDARVVKSVDRSTVNKMVLGRRTISAEELLAIAEILDYPLPSDSRPTTVTIAGRVGAGARVPVFDAYEKGDGPQVAAPPGLPASGVVAVEIEGDSMEPVYSAGDLLFYTRHTHEGVPSEAIGRRCVCEDADGHGWVKIVREGRETGIFDLYSFNDSSPPMYGVRLKWAAPVLLHWPAEMARKV